MGLNMPARTVLFTSTRKFDGVDFRHLSSGEYIQMSGRAGRRGKDDRGTVIMMLDNSVTPDAARQLLLGNPDPLNSAFTLSYNMVLNLLLVEDINPQIMLEKSFFQFQNYTSIPALEDSKQYSSGTICCLGCPYISFGQHGRHCWSSRLVLYSFPSTIDICKSSATLGNSD